MLDMILLALGLAVVYFFGYKYGRGAGITAESAKCADYISSIREDHAETVERQNNIIKQTEELLFLLADFMHDPRVFEVFSHEEINKLFFSARLVTKYHDQSTIDDVTKFIKLLQQNELARLYPEYYKSLNSADYPLQPHE